MKVGEMADSSYGDAIARRYLATHPEDADWLAGLSEADRVGVMQLWANSLEGQRHRLADECERTALVLYESYPAQAEELETMARDLRERPITVRKPPPRLT